jgi:GNAT superfamily N-acetyltransferase
MDEGSNVGRAATPDDLDAIGRCLASAFFEDPVWGRWAFPNLAARRELLPRLLGFWAEAGIRRPWVRIIGDVQAAAVWIPPGVAELTDVQEVEFAALASTLFADRADELNDLFERFAEHHPSDQPHYYLSMWGTRRDHAGRGIGTALLKENLARIDAEGMPAYLESSNPANLPRYEALGFRPRSEFGPPNGPVITTMWRAARPFA